MHVRRLEIGVPIYQEPCPLTTHATSEQMGDGVLIW